MNKSSVLSGSSADADAAASNISLPCRTGLGTLQHSQQYFFESMQCDVMDNYWMLQASVVTAAIASRSAINAFDSTWHKEAAW